MTIVKILARENYLMCFTIKSLNQMTQETHKVCIYMVFPNHKF